MELYKKEIDGKIIIKARKQIVVIKDGIQHFNPREETILADGWELYAEQEPSEPTHNELKIQSAVEARARLAETDYKVIKCMEAYLCGEPMPYDVATLHEERNAMRKTINDSEL